MLRFGEGFLFVLTRLTFEPNGVYWKHQNSNNMKVYNANTGEELPSLIEKQIENSLLIGEPYPYDLLYGDN